jgi:hypothetical protein
MLRAARVILTLIAVTLLPGRAGAGRILYASEASVARVDGFCVAPDGSLAPAPVVQVGTGPEPRRVIVGGGRLYVAHDDGVQVFAIDDHGGLSTLHGVTLFDMDPRDMVIAPGGQTLIITENGPARISRIVAYPITADGLDDNPDDFTCIQGEVGVRYRALAIPRAPSSPGKLYVTSDNGSTLFRIELFNFADDGTLQGQPTDCTGATTNRPVATTPISRRGFSTGCKTTALSDDGTMMYVMQEFEQMISTRPLNPDGTFVMKPVKKGQVGRCSVDFAKCRIKKPCSQVPVPQTCGKSVKATSLTEATVAYFNILPYRSTIFGSVFGNGQVSAFKLRSNGLLTGVPTVTTKRNLNTSPLRLYADDQANVLYVAAGLLDAIQVYALDQNGMLISAVPFNVTTPLTNSYPNDITVAELAGSCG